MIKKVRSEGYNYNFDTENGLFFRWGKSLKDNPSFSPFGPELLDVELTTICSGPNGVPCNFCYKSNTPNGKNMSLETFKQIFHKIPNNVTQIAFGVDAKCASNPEVWDIFSYCREHSVIPNVTVANIDMVTAKKLVDLCGAVAVSRYADKDVCYDSVARLTHYGLKQVNIHALISEETFPQVLETIEDYKTDKRLKGLNAIVFLSLKKKGRGKSLNTLSIEKFEILVDKATEAKIGFGFDSCSAGKFLKIAKGKEIFANSEIFCEPCESFGSFSAYINVEGKYFPCSFCEEVFGGIDILKCTDFLADVWFSSTISSYRKIMEARFSLKNYDCPVFMV